MEEKVIKLEKEYIDRITELQTKFVDNINKIGQITVELSNLNAIKDSLLNEYLELKKIEKSLVDEIGNKYGYGKLDIAKGELTIIPQNQ